MVYGIELPRCDPAHTLRALAACPMWHRGGRVTDPTMDCHGLPIVFDLDRVHVVSVPNGEKCTHFDVCCFRFDLTEQL